MEKESGKPLCNLVRGKNFDIDTECGICFLERRFLQNCNRSNIKNCNPMNTAKILEIYFQD